MSDRAWEQPWVEMVQAGNWERERVCGEWRVESVERVERVES